jgi:hypothetical protein
LYEFSFKIHFESEDVPMKKVVSLIKSFKPIFYFIFSELGRSFLDRMNFEWFETV